ncbi:transposase [Candidatus Woesearchaeota archaeon]|nr:transposase [Candidatus Woesearchaeota archaeon]
MNTIAKQAVVSLVDVVEITKACSLFGLARSSYYYQPIPIAQQQKHGGGKQPNALSAAEQDKILNLLTSDRYCDRSPRQAHAEMLDDGLYLASPRSFARILQKNGQSRNRQLQRSDMVRPKPVAVANDCNELWSWDTSPLATTTKRLFFHLYIIMDVYSRFAVRWLVAPVERAEIAEKLFRDACATYDVDTTDLVSHSDNGPIQRSDLIADCFKELGITKSHSRPHVSNDNPYSESLFKTAKYQPGYPWQFETIEQAQAWADQCFLNYNFNHYHSGIAMLTPASVYFGTAVEVIQRRQLVLDDAFKVHPERFRSKPPIAKGPQPAWINKPADQPSKEPYEI